MYTIHSQNGYRVWKWRFHSELAVMGFPFSNKNKMCNEKCESHSNKENVIRVSEKSHIFSLRMGLPIPFILIIQSAPHTKMDIL